MFHVLGDLAPRLAFQLRRAVKRPSECSVVKLPLEFADKAAPDWCLPLYVLG
jgi:hypothetical protein